jgi:ketosteroid isomerase-like protein
MWCGDCTWPPPPATWTRSELNVGVAHHYTVRGGRIVRFEQFVDSALVRQAMP